MQGREDSGKGKGTKREGKKDRRREMFLSHFIQKYRRGACNTGQKWSLALRYTD